jgi:hypothetical protein
MILPDVTLSFICSGDRGPSRHAYVAMATADEATATVSQFATPEPGARPGIFIGVHLSTAYLRAAQAGDLGLIQEYIGMGVDPRAADERGEFVVG